MKFFSRNKVSSTVLAASIAAASLSFAAPVAAEQDSFACDPGFYQVIAGQLAELDPASEAYQTIGEDLSSYNAMGYRIEDGYLYGISGTTLHRVNNKGERTNLATLDIVGGSYTGDFDDAGLLNISRGGRNWYKVDVDTFEAKTVPEFDNYTAVADITNVHGTFYGVSSDGTLYSYDQTSLETREVGSVSGLPETLKAYGAAWSTSGGNLYVGRNSGEIYQVTGYTTGTPEAHLVGRAPSTSSNDGASCSLAVPIPGLDDVDGPESESTPRTPEAVEAAANYVENFAEISSTFTQAEPEAESEPVSTTVDGTYTFDDAQLGTGPGCETGGDVDRPDRGAGQQMVGVSSETELFATGFDKDSLAKFKIMSGSWTATDGALLQNHDCGYDYTVLLSEYHVTDFVWEASFNAINDSNQGGLLINQASAQSRSGAMIVDLADGGNILRWGEYDDKGYYQNIGSMQITAPKSGENITLSVEVHSNSVAISMNGELIEETESTHAGGMVGLVASLTAISFDEARLVALPASDTVQSTQKAN